MKTPDPKFRHEFKYLISAAQLPLLKARVAPLLKPDPHAGEDGTYTIRSLYFDDYHDRCYYENENGTDPREKFRIRIYNHSSAKISLECKRKDHGKTLKTACPLTEAQTRLLCWPRSAHCEKVLQTGVHPSPGPATDLQTADEQWQVRDDDLAGRLGLQLLR